VPSSPLREILCAILCLLLQPAGRSCPPSVRAVIISETQYVCT
jgi:hypothetical protein